MIAFVTVVAGLLEAHVGLPAAILLRPDLEACPSRFGLAARLAVSPGVEVRLELPVDCRLTRGEEPRPGQAGVLSETRLYCCDAAILGRRLRVAGLAEAGVPALVRFEAADGAWSAEALLDVRADEWQVPEAPGSAPEPTELGSGAFLPALAVGARHLLAGADHVLYVAGVLLLPLTWRRRATTLSAFTLAHTVSLALVAFRVVAPPSAWVELGIALSLVALAYQALEPGVRFPELTAAAFGLLHGFGFAGGLTSVSPSSSTLLGFTLGLEVAQLGVLLVGVAALAVVGAVWRERLRAPLAYALGAVAAAWCLERGAHLGL